MLGRCRALMPAYTWLANAASRPPSACSCSPYSTAEAGPSPEGDRRKLVNKLLYRSKQRGFLELDLLMGLWAEEAIPAMPLPMLQQFSDVLDEENPDLFKWLTGQLEEPERLQKNPAYQALRSHVSAQMAENAQPASLAAQGQEWVRGWDDSWRGSSSQSAQQGGDAGVRTEARGGQH